MGQHRSITNGWFAFFQEFLKHPLQVGSIIPRSRFLEGRVVEAARVSSANTIVELGPGSGGTTRAILKAMAQNARLLSIEINPHLHALVSRIGDNRLISHFGDAQQLKQILSMYSMERPEVVISGIPFSTMSRISGTEIIEMVSSMLAAGGRFVVYQVSRRVASFSESSLGLGRLEVELLNIPPMRVYRWEKHDAERIGARNPGAENAPGNSWAGHI